LRGRHAVAQLPCHGRVVWGERAAGSSWRSGRVSWVSSNHAGAGPSVKRARVLVHETGRTAGWAKIRAVGLLRASGGCAAGCGAGCSVGPTAAVASSARRVRGGFVEGPLRCQGGAGSSGSLCSVRRPGEGGFDQVGLGCEVWVGVRGEGAYGQISALPRSGCRRYAVSLYFAIQACERHGRRPVWRAPHVPPS